LLQSQLPSFFAANISLGVRKPRIRSYGLIALTLVWPSVSKIIRIVAYMWGNVAMAVGDSSPLYVWDFNTIRAITDPLAQPQYTIAFAAFAMGLGALCLYGTPFISLYLLSGRIYESVATVTSSWMGAIVGTGFDSDHTKVEWASRPGRFGEFS